MYPPNATIQLYGGPNERSGLLLVYIESLFNWGTVCDDNFDSIAAAVACRQLGLGPPQAFYNPNLNPSAVWAPLGTPILLDNFACDGTEPSLQACPLFQGEVGEHNCAHYEDINLVCTKQTRSVRQACRRDPSLTFIGLVPIVSVRLLQARRRSRRPRLHPLRPRRRQLRPRQRRRRPLHPPHVRRARLRSLVTRLAARLILPCAHRHNCVRADRDVATAPSSSIMLVNGADARSGVLLVYINSLGYWGTVCNDDFDTRAAEVACRQLDLGTPEGWQSLSKPASAPSGTPIVLDEFICSGTELTLQSCTRRYGQPPTHNCDHSEDIYLTCTRNDTTLRSQP